MKALRLLSLPVTMLRRRLGGAGWPRFLTHTVTFACNARCVMCDSWRKDTTGELSLGEIEAIYRQLPPMDMVRLTGGEPFVRPDLPEIARLALQWLRPLCLHVTTNGFLSDRIVRFCETRDRATPLRLLVSIDGPPESHDAIRGHPGAFRAAMDTLAALAPRRSELNLVLGVNQTILDPAGIEAHRRLASLLQPHRIPLHVVLAYRQSALYNRRRAVNLAPAHPGQYRPFGQFSRQELQELFAVVETGIRRLPWADQIAKRYYWRGLQARLLGEGCIAQPPCVALHAHLRLLPDGRVPVCQFNTEAVGSLRRTSFRTLWRSRTATRHRRWVRSCPGCWAECEVLPSALYSGAILRMAWELTGDSPAVAPGPRHVDRAPAPQDSQTASRRS